MLATRKIVGIVGIVILVAGIGLAASPVKVWDFPKEVEDLLTEDRRQWAFKMLPYMQQGYKIRVVFEVGEEEGEGIPTLEELVVEEEAMGEEGEQQVFVAIMRTTTLLKMFPTSVVRQLPSHFSFDNVKAVSVKWVVGSEGDFEWEVTESGEYSVLLLPYEGEMPMPVEGSVYLETQSETYRWAGILMVIVGAVVTIRGWRGRLLPAPV